MAALDEWTMVRELTRIVTGYDGDFIRDMNHRARLRTLLQEQVESLYQRGMRVSDEHGLIPEGMLRVDIRNTPDTETGITITLRRGVDPMRAH